MAASGFMGLEAEGSRITALLYTRRKDEETDPADVLELLGSHIVGMDKEELVVGVEQVAQLLIVLHTTRRASAGLFMSAKHLSMPPIPYVPVRSCIPSTTAIIITLHAMVLVGVSPLPSWQACWRTAS